MSRRAVTRQVTKAPAGCQSGQQRRGHERRRGAAGEPADVAAGEGPAAAVAAAPGAPCSRGGARGGSSTATWAPIVDAALATLAARPHALVGVTVMPGPQVAPAIEISAAIRAAFPADSDRLGRLLPHAVSRRGHQRPLRRLRGPRTGRGDAARPARTPPDAGQPSPLDSARDSSAIRDGRRVDLEARRPSRSQPRTADRQPRRAAAPPLRTARRRRGYLRPSFMGDHTAVHQAALGCRFKCEFCGVVSMWNGNTRARRARRGSRPALVQLRDRWGADGVQFYDHNFFDREESSVPDPRGAGPGSAMPWWCYARADTLARFSAATWQLIRKQPAAHDVHRRGGRERRRAGAHAQGIPRRPHPGGGGAAAARTASSPSSLSCWAVPRIRRARSRRR